MNDVLFLILFPLIIALLVAFIPKTSIRDLVVKASAVIIAAAALYLLVVYGSSGTVFFPVSFEPLSQVMFFLEMGLALFLLYLAYRFRNPIAGVLIVIQTALIIIFEAYFIQDLNPLNNLFIDQFSIIMALIIGIIGTLIGVYALFYMETYHRQHPEVKDRRPWFFFLIFIFLSAMFGLIFSNNLLWVFFFWEITTICSFLLIGYAQTAEASKSAFLALIMNLIGGIAFAAAILYLAQVDPSGSLLEINNLLSSGQVLVLIPVGLICFAGITKAALMPFSSWLVGAMVAPTPVSALLHSSTMVKAGVYIIVRFAPVLTGNPLGYAIALVGGVTFLLASGIAISQSNGKKVLAYSTIANLGLITACAGIGTYMLVWAAILLIIFHAIAKSLLFMSVGVIEQRIGSKDIEDMDSLIVRMPKIAIMMFIGIAGMFLAPFGMLISKWAAIEAFILAPAGLIFVAILAFGGSITVFFWAKWMGKIISVEEFRDRVETTFWKEKWMPLYITTGLVILVTLIFPLISGYLIEPFILAIYGQTARLSQENITIMLLMLCLILIMPLSMLYYQKRGRHVTPYMGGRTTSPTMVFRGSLGVDKQAVLSNYYLESYFGESRLRTTGNIICLGLLLFAAVAVAGVIL
jgi:ech hydrogenase subunit A